MINASLPPKTPSSTSNSPPILGPNGFKRYFVVHGGLFSKDEVTLDDIRKLPRLGRQPGQEGIMCELLWTDPQEMPGRGPSKRVSLPSIFLLLASLTVASRSFVWIREWVSPLALMLLADGVR